MARIDCKICGGTGWTVEQKDGIPYADRCACVAESQVREMAGSSQIPPNYEGASWGTFLLPQDNPITRKALNDVLLDITAYIRTFPKGPKPGLLFVGPPGTGKTHLAVAALRLLIEKGHEGVFFDYQNLLEKIRSGYDASLGASNREAYQSAMESEILLLDDLGAHRVTDWVEDTVTAIVTYRCNHRKALIATTNLTDPEVGSSWMDKTSPSGKTYRTTLEDRIGERARSRLFEMCKVIRMPNVEDYRIKRLRA